MKRFYFLSLIAIFSAFALCANAQNPGAKQAKANSPDQPYKVEATNISIGNMAYAQKVLRAWKDYDNNTMDNLGTMFTEDVLATFPDGTVIKGRDNFIKAVKDMRNGFDAASSIVHACTTLKSPDQPDREVVSIWGKETDTNKDGTVTATQLNEVWFFNKQGQVTEFHQLAAKDVAEKKQ
jgi:ketosteroid isomerase-like protein